MLLIKGKIYENVDKTWAINLVREEIVKTLSNKPLNINLVFSAANQLAEDVLDGKFDKEFERFLDNDLLSSYDIESIASMLKTDLLRERYNLEIGSLNESLSKNQLKILPLGSLLHIAAGNMDILPAYSVLEGLLAGNINILKLPSMDSGFSLFLLSKLIEYEPILKEYIYVFDTPSSDLSTIQSLMELTNAIVIWGDDDTIKAVRANAPINAKIIEWGHKISFAYINQLQVPHEKLEGLARHIFSTGQLLCSSCQAIFINTNDFKDVIDFGKRFSNIMKEMEDEYSFPLSMQAKVSIELLTRSYENIYTDEVIFKNKKSSLICKNDHKLESSFQFGNILVKPLPKDKIIECLYENKSHLQTVGLYPMEQSSMENNSMDDNIVDVFTRIGLTNIHDIDAMSTYNILSSHDGKFPLLEYSKIVSM